MLLKVASIAWNDFSRQRAIDIGRQGGNRWIDAHGALQDLILGDFQCKIGTWHWSIVHRGEFQGRRGGCREGPVRCSYSQRSPSCRRSLLARAGPGIVAIVNQSAIAAALDRHRGDGRLWAIDVARTPRQQLRRRNQPRAIFGNRARKINCRGRRRIVVHILDGDPKVLAGRAPIRVGRHYSHIIDIVLAALVAVGLTFSVGLS